MRVPLNWLREYVAVEASVSELVRLLNFSGTKVEAVHRSLGDVSGVVTAKVVAIQPHPNADNLILVDVEASSGDVEQVVCGAKNFSVGDLVPYAQVGARLPDMVIAERKIRGQMSRGMLCSGRELGVGKDHSGILVLPPDATVGDDVADVLDLNDTIVELELTPNRPDCMGMVGIAREVAALTGSKMTTPEADVPPASSSSHVSVELQDPAGCPRYVARYLEGITVAPSPRWIAARLLAVGIRPISNVVDVTNYVMMELGHPLHPFDATQVRDRSIIVRRAANDEWLRTLDGVTRSLAPEDLLITDPDRILALAGVMGGADSEVSGETSSVILEAAYFDAPSIARTSRRHQLRSEASARFERGMDPEAPPFAAARAAELIARVAGGDGSNEAVDVYPAPVVRPRISLRSARTDRLLGVAVDPQRQGELLRSVGFTVAEGPEVLEVDPPSFRPDVTQEVDLIEEVARLEGLDKLPSTLPPGRVGGLDPSQGADRVIRRTVAGLGVREAWTSTFMSPRDLDALKLDASHPARSAIEVANPMSEEEKLLRTTLLPGLLNATRHNLARGAGGAALFEVASVYLPSSEPLPHEPTMLGGVFSGARRHHAWDAGAMDWDFFAVKGIVTALLDSLRVAPPAFTRMGDMPFHPTRAARLTWGDTAFGALGELHPDVCEAFDVAPGTIAFEVAVETLLAALPGPPTPPSLPRFPAVLIDLAIVVDAAQEAGAITDAIRSAGAPETTNVRLFDVYSGPQVPEGKKSLAFALALRVPDRTLTTEDAAVVKDRIVAELAERFGARLRA
ncbi:MAG TPA: phenylalanine--tRNA ligase subunit beta [Actinomycetota bacterium]|nr:phenylalanine--tRNA ligase subunit beta [Actinomycetota bacterium]